MGDPLSISRKTTLFWQLFHSMPFRLLRLFLIGLCLLLPLGFISQWLGIQEQQHNQVVKALANSWGEQQTLIGPLLVVPYVEHIKRVDTVTDANGEKKVVSNDTFNDHTLVLLPTELDIRSDIKQEVRQQNNYSTPVYSATISLTGNFDHSIVLGDETVGERRILWEKAYLALGLSDPKSMDTTSSIFWNNERLKVEPGTQLPALLTTGFHAALPSKANSDMTHPFKLTITLRGSEGLYFAPVGETTKIHLNSAWAQADFTNHLLPNKYELTEQGFIADWQIPYLVRNYPQAWELELKQTYDLANFSVGVGLNQPEVIFTKIQQALPYGIGLIGFGLLTLFLLEWRFAANNLSVLPYILVGFSLILFYPLWLTLAKPLALVYAYASAAGLSIILVTLYVKSLFHTSKPAIIILMILLSLFGVLYLLLNFEFYTTPIATLALIIALALIMYVTRLSPNAIQQQKLMIPENYVLSPPAL